MSKKNDKIQITAAEFRALAARIADEKATPESKPAEPDERERLKTEAARLKVEREKIRAEYERERLRNEREHARNASNADERESRRRFIVALFYGGIVAAFLIWSIIIVARYF